MLALTSAHNSQFYLNLALVAIQNGIHDQSTHFTR